MKRNNLLVSVLALSLVTFLSASVRTAAANVGPSYQFGVVTGVVTGLDKYPAVGANVSVQCNSQTLSTTTDGSGLYNVSYGNGQCPEGNLVTVTATKGGESGSNSGTMNNAGGGGFVKLDVAIVNVPMVPEFGLMTGAFTFFSSGGVMYFLRKRA